MAIALGAHNTSTGTTSSWTTTGITTQTSGSRFFIMSATSSLTSVSDNKGNTWTQLYSYSVSGVKAAVWTTTGAGGAGHTVTLGFSSASDRAAAFIELTGASSIDANVQAGASGLPVSASTSTLTNAAEFAIALLSTDNAATTATATVVIESSGMTVIESEAGGGAANRDAWAVATQSLSSTSAKTSTFSATNSSLGGIVLLTVVPTVNPPSGNSNGFPVGGFVAVGTLLNASSGPVTHTTTGSLTGQLGAVSGVAARIHAFSTTGTLVGQGSSIVGSAARSTGAIAHGTSGALVGQSSSIAATAIRFRAFSTAGILIGGAPAITGAAARFRAFGTAGVLSGSGSSVAGTATRFRVFSTAGALVGSGSAIVAAATHTSVIPSHDTTGTLVGGGSSVAGAATRFRAFSATGGLTGSGSSVSSAALRSALHTSTGVLVGASAQVTGAAVHALAAVTHSTSGVLSGAGATVAGAAQSLSGSYTLTGAQAVKLYQIYLLHGLGPQLTVGATQRTAGAISQTIVDTGTSTTITTDASGATVDVPLGTIVDELAALHGIGAVLTATATARTAGSITQVLATAAGTTTVTRI